ncbi:MAG: glutamate--tRNA ligase [Rhodospirillaceae bacterium]|jgi:glutamyl-tRNA synthetase|nr:glutamate--tRNA ligase [Rhodospirillaceae bacterium]
MTVVTRFAPSPTGFLHIGGARTALFNWLYARHHGGQFLLRIEDTDRKRSTDEAIAAIVAGLRWLELDWDGEEVHQSHGVERHKAAAQQLLKEGKAYLCYCTPEELTEMREEARRNGQSMRYDGRWRDRDPAEAPVGVNPVVRLKAPQEGVTVVDDKVQGPVRVENTQLDDMILLRGDGTPTYMHSVVVDDHDMGVTHVIRGDDHLTNAARQTQLFAAFGWDIPTFAHIPLIHGPDGQKLSKRHGALGVEAYRDMGYLPAALRNYLLRLGWSHGDDELISTEQAVAWFDLDGVGRSPSRMDFAKLESVNAHYIHQSDTDALVDLIIGHLTVSLGAPISDDARGRILAGLEGLRQRAKTLIELADAAVIYVNRPVFPLTNAKAARLLENDGRELVTESANALSKIDNWSEETIESAVRSLAESHDLGFGKIAQPLRAALTGSNASPSIFEVMQALGKSETMARLNAVP